MSSAGELPTGTLPPRVGAPDGLLDESTLRGLRGDTDTDAAPDQAETSPRGWTGVFGSTRTRMLVTYLLLLGVSGALTTFGIHWVLGIRLADRTEAALRQEIPEVQRLMEDGRDPLTGRPFQSLRRAFDVYFDRNVPSVEEAFIAMAGPRVYLDRLRSFPGREIPKSALDTFAAFSSAPGPVGEQQSGRFGTPQGTARYRAVRVAVGAQTGAFVVTILPAAGLREIEELQTYGAGVTLAVVLFAAICAWFLAGRVLAPVQELTATARSISESDLTGRVSVGRSSEAREMAETFNAMLDRLEAVFRSQLQFLRSAGHELRTPLTVATGHLEVLGDDPEERRTTFPLVLDELHRMGRLVDDLQSLAESTHPDFLVPQPLPLPQLANELIGKARMLGERRWQLEEAADGILVADRDRLSQAVLNLADNAVKNTEEDDTIAIGVGIRGPDVHIWVRDTGIGVAPAESDRVFGRFVRGREAGRRYRGAGLGLAIVKTIAEAHGGSVRLDSPAGGGSRFVMILPLREVPWRES